MSTESFTRKIVLTKEACEKLAEILDADFKEFLEENNDDIHKIVGKNPITITREELDDNWDLSYDEFKLPKVEEEDD